MPIREMTVSMLKSTFRFGKEGLNRLTWAKGYFHAKQLTSLISTLARKPTIAKTVIYSRMSEKLHSFDGADPVGVIGAMRETVAHQLGVHNRVQLARFMHSSTSVPRRFPWL